MHIHNLFTDNQLPETGAYSAYNIARNTQPVKIISMLLKWFVELYSTCLIQWIYGRNSTP